MVENKGFIKDESKFVIFPIIALGLFFVLQKIIFSSETMFFLFPIIVCIFIIIYIFKFIKSELYEKNKQEKYSQIIDRLKEKDNQFIYLFLGYILLQSILVLIYDRNAFFGIAYFDVIYSSAFMIMIIFIYIKSEFINKNKQEKIAIPAENNQEYSKKELIKTYIKKEFLKIILIQIIFTFITRIWASIFISWYGGLTEYIKHSILKLFTSYSYVGYALETKFPIDKYFQYIQEEYHITNLYLWIIPFCMAIIYTYISYWIAHKIVDRSGIGATHKLNFFYFFLIFGISHILARVICYGTTEANSISFLVWIGELVHYVIYKILKISLLKLKEKSKKQGE